MGEFDSLRRVFELIFGKREMYPSDIDDFVPAPLAKHWKDVDQLLAAITPQDAPAVLSMTVKAVADRWARFNPETRARLLDMAAEDPRLQHLKSLSLLPADSARLSIPWAASNVLWGEDRERVKEALRSWGLDLDAQRFNIEPPLRVDEHPDRVAAAFDEILVSRIRWDLAAVQVADADGRRQFEKYVVERARGEALVLAGAANEAYGRLRDSLRLTDAYIRDITREIVERLDARVASIGSLQPSEDQVRRLAQLSRDLAPSPPLVKPPGPAPATPDSIYDVLVRKALSVKIVAVAAIVLVALIALGNAFDAVEKVRTSFVWRYVAGAPGEARKADSTPISCTFIMVPPIAGPGTTGERIVLSVTRDLVPVDEPIEKQIAQLKGWTLIAAKGMAPANYEVQLTFNQRPEVGQYQTVKGPFYFSATEQVYNIASMSQISGLITLEPVPAAFVPRLVDNARLRLPNCSVVRNYVTWITEGF